MDITSRTDSPTNEGIMDEDGLNLEYNDDFQMMEHVRSGHNNTNDADMDRRSANGDSGHNEQGLQAFMNYEDNNIMGNLAQESEDDYDGNNIDVNLESLEEGEECKNKTKKFPRSPGDINCLWFPHGPKSLGHFGLIMKKWINLNCKQISSGIAVSITQLAQAATYSVIAGVDPVTAVSSSLMMNLITSIIGGRQGMITGVSIVSAIAISDVVKTHGEEYIFYTVSFSGLLQILFGIFGFGVISRMVPYSVLTGFVNAMAIVIFFAQFRFFKIEPEDMLPQRDLIEVGYSYQSMSDERPWASSTAMSITFIEAAMTILLCLIFSKWATQMSNVALSILSIAVVEWIIVRQIGLAAPLLSDLENVTEVIPRSFSVPPFLDERLELPPLSFETFQKIFWPAISITCSNLVESIMTKVYLDERIGTKGHTNRMIVGQGCAQLFTSIMGGIGGGANLDQSMVNNISGGYTSLSQAVAAISLFLIIICAAPIVGSIPLGAIIGVMVYVAGNMIQIDTFKKMLSSLFPQQFRDRINLNGKIQRGETFTVLVVMLITIFVDAGIAVVIGVTLSVYVYAWDSGDRIMILREIDPDEDTVTYYISGHIFFATRQLCLQTFTEDIIKEDPNDVIINLEGAEIFDWSGMLALKILHDRLVQNGKVVAFSSLSASSRRLMEKCSSMWEGINFLFIEEIAEEEKTLVSSTHGGASL